MNATSHRAQGRTPLQSPPVVELVERQAAARPGDPALVRHGVTVTYLELERRAGALAAELRRLGVTAESPVGLLTGRAPELVVGALGILKAGGAYVPLDPSYPEERLLWILGDTGTRTVVVGPAHRDQQERLGHRLPATVKPLFLDLDRAVPEPGDSATGATRPDARRLAYVIYTSGSTGRPKGVLVSHGALANLAAWHRRAFGVGPADRASLIAGVGFDASVWEVWPYLTAGASLHFAPEEVRTSPANLRDWLVAESVTVSFVPTPLAEGLVQVRWPEAEGALRFLLTGGDRLRRWPGPGLPFQLVNNYGPTENAVVTTSGKVAADCGGSAAGPPPIGRAIDGVAVELVDPRFQPVAAGEAGELTIAGQGLARGYLGRPALTAAAFVPDPFSGTDGGRLYRTGDLCRRRPDGEIEFLGRADDQVKVRGHRIELGEVEAALARHPGIREATVVAHEGPSGVRLVGYVVPGSGTPEELSSPALREYLANTLPSPMIPGLFLLLDEMPLTPNGKVDRGALPVPPEERTGLGPGTLTERHLLALFRELFGQDTIGLDSDFFELGGHSLIIVQLCARLREDPGVELDPQAIFEMPTVRLLAEHVDRSEHGEPIPPIRRADRGRDLRLSFAQERVWFLQELVPNTVAYNSQLLLRLRGPLDVDCLGRAFSEVVRRHEILRTRFVVAPSGRPVQRVEPPFEVRVPVRDLRELPRDAASERLDALVWEEITQPFQLDRLPLVRWLLYRLGETEHVLLQVEHHFLHDGWSISVLLRELQEVYSAFLEGRGHDLPEPPVQYVDFALWQRDWLQGAALERQLDYWRRRLGDAPPILELPLDRPRPERSTFHGKALDLVLPQELYGGLRAMSHRGGWTLYITMLTAMYALLGRVTGGRDLVLGSGMANRRLRELESMIGMVVNTVLLRTDLTGDPSVLELLGRVRETVLEAQVHQDLPLEKLVEDLRPDRDSGHNPLVQMLFSFHDAPVPELGFAGLESEIRYLNNGTAKMDLNVIGIPRAEQRRGQGDVREQQMGFLWEYNDELFDRTTMVRLWRHYLHLLSAMVEHPERRLSELPWLSAAERLRMIGEWNDTATAFPALSTIDQLVAEQARRRGGAVAVAFEGRTLTYAELEGRANLLAHELGSLGVAPEVPVALYVHRSLEMVVALLAILKAGGAYVPLDLGNPPARLEQILDEVDPPVILTQKALRGTLPGRRGARVVELDAEDVPAGGAAVLSRSRPEGLAYVMYTSGSTGRPKGVAVSHQNVLRLVCETGYLDFGPERVFLQFAPVSFDASTLEIWGPLVHGGRLVVYPSTLPSLDDLARVVAASEVDTLWLTAGLFHQLTDEHLEQMKSLRQLLAGGDVLLPEAVRRTLGKLPETTLVNGYGPTEGTTFTCCQPIRAARDVGSSVSIGRPIANTTVYLLDASFQPVAPGSSGELLAGGAGLARGYFNQPRLTAERFVPDPFSRSPGARLYRTGDLARFLADGRIDFLGRRDLQVKVRGFRIELDEVEGALDQHPGVRKAVVVAPRDAFGDRRLVAYWVPEEGAEPEVEELRAFLREALPGYLVPSIFMRLGAIPLTPSGKVDRKALPVPDAHAGLESSFEPPKSAIAKGLAKIWEDHLETKVGVHDGFFDLGGHSILAIRILTHIRKEFSVELSLHELLHAKSVAGLEKIVEQRQLAAADEDLLLELLAEVGGD